jgi:hypothetical protein
MIDPRAKSCLCLRYLGTSVITGGQQISSPGLKHASSTTQPHISRPMSDTELAVSLCSFLLLCLNHKAKQIRDHKHEVAATNHNEVLMCTFQSGRYSRFAAQICSSHDREVSASQGRQQANDLQTLVNLPHFLRPLALDISSCFSNNI